MLPSINKIKAKYWKQFLKKNLRCGNISGNFGKNPLETGYRTSFCVFEFVCMERSWRFFTKQINPRSLRSLFVKGTEESTLEVDWSFPLTRHDPKDLGLICLVKGIDLFSKETQNPFSDSFGFKNPILDFLKETHPWFPVLFFDIGHPCYDWHLSKQSIPWPIPYHRLKFRTHQRHVFFEVDRWQGACFWLDHGLIMG